MAQIGQDILAQLCAQREGLRALEESLFDEVMARARAGAALDAPDVEWMLALRGHIIEAIAALSQALRAADGAIADS